MASARNSGRRPLRPDDLYQLQSVSEVELHPDDAAAVYAVTWPDRDSDSNRSNLYRVGLDGAARFRLPEVHHDSSPRFSPDGTQLAFIRSAPERPGRVMVLDWPSGELRTAAEFADGGPSRIAWLGGGHIVTLAPQRPASQSEDDDDERNRRPKVIGSPLYRFNGRGYYFDRPNQLWLVDLNSQDQEPGDVPIALGEVGLDHDSFAISPDGSSVMATAPVDDNDRVSGGNRILRYDLSSTDDGGFTAGEPTTLTPAPGGWAELLWHPADGLFVIGSDDLSTIEFNRLYRVDPLAPGAPAEIGRASCRERV